MGMSMSSEIEAAMQAWARAERRDTHRQPCQLTGAMVGDRQRECMVFDLCANGMGVRIHTEQFEIVRADTARMQVGDRVELVLPIPGDTRRARVRGVVRWLTSGVFEDSFGLWFANANEALLRKLATIRPAAAPAATTRPGALPQRPAPKAPRAAVGAPEAPANVLAERVVRVIPNLVEQAQDHLHALAERSTDGDAQAQSIYGAVALWNARVDVVRTATVQVRRWDLEQLGGRARPGDPAHRSPLARIAAALQAAFAEACRIEIGAGPEASAATRALAKVVDDHFGITAGAGAPRP